MSNFIPENPPSTPPPVENIEIKNEAPSLAPEAPIEKEFSNEQVEKHAIEVENNVKQEALEIVPEAEKSIESSATSMKVSPETMRVTKQEQGLDGQLAEVQAEADQLFNEARQEIKLVMESKENSEEGRENDFEVIKRQSNESQTAYLARAGKLVTDQIEKARGEGVLFVSNSIQEKDLSPLEQGLIKATMEEARHESPVISTIDNSVALEKIEKNIGINGKLGDETLDEIAFEKTQRTRKFFEIQSGKNRTRFETHWNTLFFPYNTEATHALGKEILDDKTVILLGGGRARLKEEMTQNNITPKEVFNIDPFVSKVETGADPVIPANATDERLPDILKEHGVEKADEIWAVYSVPAYLKDPSEIKNLFKNIDTLLAENGSARIWPTEVKDGTEIEVSARKTALIESLNGLAASGRYEITEFEAANRPGFVLHRVASDKNKSELPENKYENIVSHLTAKQEKQVKDIMDFDLESIGYTKQELSQNEEFRATFEQYVRGSGDNPKQFLDLLQSKGIRIVEKSDFLASQQPSEQFMAKISGRGGSGINALFATQEMFKNYLAGDISETVRKELTKVQDSPGAIFLGKNPDPKSIFHEGAHAVQYLSKMDMNAGDEETKLRREIEVNIALIRAKNAGLLNNVSRGEYHIGRSALGETATLKGNDIYQEVHYFKANLAKLDEIKSKEIVETK